MPNAPAAAASGPPAIVSPGVPRTSALAEQARELAQIQRQLDAGAIAEAIRRLEVSYTSDPGCGLAQERDAMYVAALIKAQRNAQAIDLAKRFLMRYPNSPHSEKMRHLINAE